MDERKDVPDEAKKQTMLFAQLVEILTQNAIMMLGALPDRQGRQRPPDLNGAEMMIEMISMLQRKTKGNLNKEEERILSGTLYQLQTAFAEVASKTGEFGKAHKATEAAEAVEEDDLVDEMEEESLPVPPSSGNAGAPPPPAAKPQGIHSSASQSSENKIKFSKKYG